MPLVDPAFDWVSTAMLKFTPRAIGIPMLTNSKKIQKLALGLRGEFTLQNQLCLSLHGYDEIDA
jgi:hypothetical protein